MSQFLPPNLLALFKAPEPLEFKPPVQPMPHERKYSTKMLGIAEYVKLFEDPKDTPPAAKIETRDEIRQRKKKAREARHKAKLEELTAAWTPKEREDGVTQDPFKTLFVARLNFETSESKLRREFEEYGPIKSIFIIKDKEGKPRGYAFIEYEHERDMHSAYKRSDGRKIEGRRVVVDVERARTVDEWKPRYLGGGLGGTRRGAPQENTRGSGREGDRESSSHRSSSYRESSRYDDRDRDRDRGSSRSYRDRESSSYRDRDRDRGGSHRDRDSGHRSSRDDRGSRRRDRSRSRERDRD